MPVLSSLICGGDLHRWHSECIVWQSFSIGSLSMGLQVWFYIFWNSGCTTILSWMWSPQVWFYIYETWAVPGSLLNVVPSMLCLLLPVLWSLFAKLHCIFQQFKSKGSCRLPEWLLVCQNTPSPLRGRLMNYWGVGGGLPFGKLKFLVCPFDFLMSSQQARTSPSMNEWDVSGDSFNVPIIFHGKIAHLEKIGRMGHDVCVCKQVDEKK